MNPEDFKHSWVGLNGFELEYELTVSSLYNTTHLVIGDKREKTFKVEVKVEV